MDDTRGPRQGQPRPAKDIGLDPEIERLLRLPILRAEPSPDGTIRLRCPICYGEHRFAQEGAVVMPCPPPSEYVVLLDDPSKRTTELRRSAWRRGIYDRVLPTPDELGRRIAAGEPGAARDYARAVLARARTDGVEIPPLGEVAEGVRQRAMALRRAIRQRPELGELLVLSLDTRQIHPLAEMVRILEASAEAAEAIELERGASS